jgi:hypothetical protein
MTIPTVPTLPKRERLLSLATIFYPAAPFLAVKAPQTACDGAGGVFRRFPYLPLIFDSNPPQSARTAPGRFLTGEIPMKVVFKKAAQLKVRTRSTMSEKEKILSPAGTIFPKSGDIYLCVKDCEVVLQIYFAAPYSNNILATLKIGQLVTVFNMNEEDEKPLWVSADPNDPALEEKLVPAEDLKSEKPPYDGFSLLISTAQLNTHFKWIGHDNSFDNTF